MTCRCNLLLNNLPYLNHPKISRTILHSPPATIKAEHIRPRENSRGKREADYYQTKGNTGRRYSSLGGSGGKVFLLQTPRIILLFRPCVISFRVRSPEIYSVALVS